MVSRTRPTRQAFTKIEMTVLILIALVMIGLSLPAVQKMRLQAARSLTMSNLKTLGLSIHKCQDTYKRLPPSVGHFPIPKSATQGTIFYWLLPFLGQEDTYKMGQPPAVAFDTPTWYVPGLRSKVILPLVSPLDPAVPAGFAIKGDAYWGVSHFAANVRVFGQTSDPNNTQKWAEAPIPYSADKKARFPESFQDGTSNTITFVTRYGICDMGGSLWADGSRGTDDNPWAPFFGHNVPQTLPGQPGERAGTGVPFLNQPTQPPDPLDNPCRPGNQPSLAKGTDLGSTGGGAHSFTRGEIQVALADGSVRNVSLSIGPAIWAQAVHPSDGNVLPSGCFCDGGK